MNSGCSQNNGGIALIVVMLVIVVLGLLAAGFAFSMKVETRLAQNVQAENDLLWAALSGVDKAGHILAQHYGGGRRRAHALNQLWANGTGETNEALLGVSLSEKLGGVQVDLEIADLERWININYASREILERGLELVGCDTFETATILDSLEDWKDSNSAVRPDGAEEDYYLNQPRPYAPKEGPIEDLTELLLVRGVTPSMFWGAGRAAEIQRSELGAAAWLRRKQPAEAQMRVSGVGLADLFTAVGPNRININTASREVLQLLPGLDASLAESIVGIRSGMDRVDGTADDTPFESVGELATIGGLPPQFIASLGRFCGVNSRLFRVRVHLTVGTYHRAYLSYVFCDRAQSAQAFGGHWE